MITYRPIAKSDNAALAKLLRQVFEEHNAHFHSGTIYQDPTTDCLFELFQNGGSICWVACHEETQIGCCGIYPTNGLPDNYAELVKFYIHPQFRGKGVGKQLLSLCIQSALKLKYQALYLESLPEFGNAVKIYERYGFVHQDQPLGNSGHFGCTIWMVKELAPTP